MGCAPAAPGPNGSRPGDRQFQRLRHRLDVKRRHWSRAPDRQCIRRERTGVYITGTSSLSTVATPTTCVRQSDRQQHQLRLHRYADREKHNRGNLVGLNAGGFPSAATRMASAWSQFPDNPHFQLDQAMNSGVLISAAGYAEQHRRIQHDRLCTNGSAAFNGDPAVLINFAAAGGPIGASQNGTDGGNAIYSSGKGVWVRSTGAAGNHSCKPNCDRRRFARVDRRRRGGAEQQQRGAAVAEFPGHRTTRSAPRPNGSRRRSTHTGAAFPSITTGPRARPGSPARGVPLDMSARHRGATNGSGHAHLDEVCRAVRQRRPARHRPGQRDRDDQRRQHFGNRSVRAESTDLIFRDDFQSGGPAWGPHPLIR